MLDVDVEGVFVDRVAVFVLGEEFLDCVVKDFVVAFGVFEAGVREVLVYCG